MNRKGYLPEGFQIMVKPIGPVCNLNCEYCFYTEKKALFPERESYRMTDQILESFIRKYITWQEVPDISFIWQGGEPTLMGLDFFRKVVKLQKQFGQGKRITNSLQTNGTMLTDEWCEFLRRHDFLVGLSLDGPADIHNRYRIDRIGKPSFQAVMGGLKLLQKHGVEFNVLACVTRETSKRPLEVYQFYKEQGVQFIQFIPIVERKPDAVASEIGLRYAMPLALEREAHETVTPWTVEPEAYGEFLIKIFDEWVRKDVSSVFVMNFEWALSSWLGRPAPVCVFSPRCGRCVVMEHNGDLYSCDHFVYPGYRLGNIITKMPGEMIESVQQVAFGNCKETELPRYCQDCEVLFACHGECPKRRFKVSLSDEPGMNYLCKGYKKFFRHIHPYMKVMVQLLEHGIPAARVMDAIKGPLVVKLL